ADRRTARLWARKRQRVNGVTAKTQKTVKFLSKRKPIRQRSGRMSKLMAYYRVRRELFLRGKMSVVYPPEKATHIHHSRGRLATLLFDERWWKPVDVSGHELIGDQPKIAREHLWLCQRGEWNVAPDDDETR